MSSTINLTTLQNLLSQIKNDLPDEPMSAEESNLLHSQCGYPGAQTCDNAYINAMKLVGATSSAERTAIMKELQKIINEMIDEVSKKNAQNAKQVAGQYVYETFQSFINNPNAIKNLETLVKFFQQKLAEIKNGNISNQEDPKIQLNRMLANYINGDKINDNALDEIKKQCEKCGIDVSNDKTVGIKRTLSFEVDGKSYTFVSTVSLMSANVRGGADTDLSITNNFVDKPTAPNPVSVSANFKKEGTIGTDSWTTEAIADAGINMNKYGKYFTQVYSNASTVWVKFNESTIKQDFPGLDIITLDDLKNAIEAKFGINAPEPSVGIDEPESSVGIDDAKAKLNNYVKLFIEGKMSQGSLRNTLADEFQISIRTSFIDTNYIIVFEFEGDTYRLECPIEEANDVGGEYFYGVAWDSYTPEDLSADGLSKQEISKYFTARAWVNKQPVGYVKNDAAWASIGATSYDDLLVKLGHKEPEVTETTDVTDDNPPVNPSDVDKLNGYIDLFIEGKMSQGKFRKTLSDEFNIKINTSADNDSYIITFDYGDKHYEVRCKIEVANDGNASGDYGKTVDVIDEATYNSLPAELKNCYSLVSNINGVKRYGAVNNETLSKLKAVYDFINGVTENAGLDNNAVVSSTTGGFRNNFNNIVNKLLPSLEGKVKTILGDKFDAVWPDILNGAIEEIITKYKGNTTVKVGDAVNEFLKLIYERIQNPGSGKPGEPADVNNPLLVLVDPEEELKDNKGVGDTKADCNYGAYFHDIGDVTDEITATLNKLKDKIKATLKNLLGSAFDEGKFNTIFANTVTDVATAYQDITEKIAVKTVVDDFINRIYTQYKAGIDSVIDSKRNELNALIDKFIGGGYSLKEVEDALKALGLKFSEAPYDAGESSSRVVVEFVDFDGKGVCMVCEKSAVNDGKNATDQTLFKGEDVAAKFSDEEIKLYFYPSLWRQGQGDGKHAIKYSKRDWPAGAGNTLDSLRYYIDHAEERAQQELDEKTKDLRNAANIDAAQNCANTYNNLTAENIGSAVRLVLDDAGLKQRIKNYIVNVLNIDESAFETMWAGATNLCIEALRADLTNGKLEMPVSGRTILNKFIEKLYTKIEEEKGKALDEMKAAAQTGIIPAYSDVEIGVTSSTLEKTVKNILDDSGMKSRLKTKAKSLYPEMTDPKWEKAYNDAINATVSSFSGKTTITGAQVIDKFLEILSLKLKSADFSNTLDEIDLTKIKGYEENMEIEESAFSSSSTAMRWIIDDIATEMTNKLKSELKTYIKAKWGLTVTDDQLKNILKDVIMDVFNNNKDLYDIGGVILKHVTCHVKDVVDKVMEVLPQYIQDNNPATKTYTKDELKAAGFTNDEINNKEYFNKTDDGKYTVKVDSSVFSEYAKTNGLITNLTDLRKAIEWLKKQESAAACGDLAAAVKDLGASKIGTMQNGQSSIHTEFGIDSDGNIVFEQKTTAEVYNKMRETLRSELKSRNIAAYNKLGYNNFNKLVQAAWIMTYKDFDSSQSNNCGDFIRKVLENFQKILTAISNNPSLLEIYTGHTTYADDDLVSGLIHYGTNTTYGDDQDIIYRGDEWTDADGVVHIANTDDDPDYQATMEDLLDRLYNKFSGILDRATIRTIFRQAQKDALYNCHENVQDCPYGTVNGSGVGSGNSMAATGDRDWAGVSREGDNGYITMQELVQLTLYHFDKLLYEKLSSGYTNT